MKKLFLGLLAIAVLPGAAHAKGTFNYAEGMTDNGYTHAESKVELELKKGTISDPGSSIRVYLRPRTGCMGVPPVDDGKYYKSTVSKVLNTLSPELNYVAYLASQPVFNANPLCDHNKQGYYTLDTIKEGNVKHRIMVDNKYYYVEITFGPNQAGKVVVLKLVIDEA